MVYELPVCISVAGNAPILLQNFRHFHVDKVIVRVNVEFFQALILQKILDNHPGIFDTFRFNGLRRYRGFGRRPRHSHFLRFRWKAHQVKIADRRRYNAILWVGI